MIKVPHAPRGSEEAYFHPCEFIRRVPKRKRPDPTLPYEVSI